MKKILLNIISIIIILSVLFTVSCDNPRIPNEKASGAHLDGNPSRDAFILPTYYCEMLFGVSPTEFFDAYLSMYQKTGDFRNGAYIDDDGNLVLNLTEKQQQTWRNLLVNDVYGVETVRNSPYISVSEDYTTLDVLCFKERVFTDFICAAYSLIPLFVNQLLDGKAAESISVKFSLKDGITEEIVDSVTWPQEDFVAKWSEYNFSSLPEDYPNTEYGEREVFKLPSEFCQLFFNVTPKEFLDSTYIFYNYTEDFRSHAYIDENEDLILKLTKYQRETLKNPIWENEIYGFISAQKSPYIITSVDYKRVEILCFQERYSRDLTCVGHSVIQMMINQWLNGVPCENISVEIVLTDGGTGEVVFFETITPNKMSFNLPYLTFSQLPPNSPETAY